MTRVLTWKLISFFSGPRTKAAKEVKAAINDLLKSLDSADLKRARANALSVFGYEDKYTG